MRTIDDFFPEIDERINPCAGCEDYEFPHGCKSNGGCGRHEPQQIIKGGEKSICPRCFHFEVCRGVANQPCVQCSQYCDMETMGWPRWIPVEKHKPTTPDDVLTWMGPSRKDMEGYCICGCYNSSTGEWVPDADWARGTVTHWVPLPAPPEVET